MILQQIKLITPQEENECGFIFFQKRLVADEKTL